MCQGTPQPHSLLPQVPLLASACQPASIPALRVHPACRTQVSSSQVSPSSSKSVPVKARQVSQSGSTRPRADAARNSYSTTTSSLGLGSVLVTSLTRLPSQSQSVLVTVTITAVVGPCSRPPPLSTQPSPAQLSLYPSTACLFFSGRPVSLPKNLGSIYVPPLVHLHGLGTSRGDGYMTRRQRMGHSSTQAHHLRRIDTNKLPKPA